jgi:hypothetical protein
MTRKAGLSSGFSFISRDGRICPSLLDFLSRSSGPPRALAGVIPDALPALPRRAPSGSNPSIPLYDKKSRTFVRLFFYFSGRTDLNRRCLGPKPSALATGLRPAGRSGRFSEKTVSSAARSFFLDWPIFPSYHNQAFLLHQIKV